MIKKIKYLLMACGLICGLNTYAQSSACDGTTPVAVVGTNTIVGPLAGAGAQTTCVDATDAVNAAWYTYTPAADATITIESCNGGVDTRASVYSGASCAALTCVAGNDDACTMGPGMDAFATSVSFAATGSTTYYIMWDDRWDASGFDWTLTESGIDCPGLGLNIGDPCDAGLGSGVVYDNCTCGPILVPDCATLLVPADGAIEVVIDPLNDGVGISWSFNGFQPTDGTNIYFGDDPLALPLLGAAGAGGTGVTITGVTPGVYYWQAVPFNAAGEAVGCDVFSFTTVGGMETEVPDCPTLVSPADGATGVVLNGDTVAITWTNALTGGIAAQNGIYFGLNPAALPFLGNAAASSETINITGVQQGLTYYWSIVPSNGVGEAIGCSEFSFTVAGTPDCPLLGVNGLNIGNICDDGDATTTNDQVLADCTCVGVPIPGNANCAGAISISDGVYAANQILGGAGAADVCFALGSVTDALWYSYTASCDGDITVSSAIDLDQPDTRLSIYTGTCAALTCVDSNDDIAVDNFTSSITFTGTAGTTYFIEWDDRWSVAEFDFEVSTGSSCPTNFDDTGASAGLTDGADFSFFLGNFGLACGDPCDCPTNLDDTGASAGITDGSDFSVFLGNFGLLCPAP